jgi:hypothetical protein
MTDALLMFQFEQTWRDPADVPVAPPGPERIAPALNEAKAAGSSHWRFQAALALLVRLHGAVRVTS